MARIDYHLHSEYSMDSREPLKNIHDKAVSEGMEEIAVTDHAELQSPEDLPDFRRREAEIQSLNENASGILTIRSGIEIGQPHRFVQEAQSLLRGHSFDFVIASLHELEGFGSTAKFAFDRDSAPFFFAQYFKELRDIAAFSDYDVLGHVTLPFRYVPDALMAEFHPLRYRREYEDIFRIVIGRGKGIEVNTSGLRTKLKETMPGLDLLRCYHSLGGNVITVGSDGHSCRSAFLGIKEGMEMIRKAGFQSCAVFSQRIGKQVTI